MNTTRIQQFKSIRSPGEQFLDILQQIQNHLNFYQTCGLWAVACASPPENSTGASAESSTSLQRVQRAIDGCQRCKLHGGRTHIVFGAGNPRADLMLIGEGPGEHEDQQGTPFVGPAGELLTKILAAIDVRRDEVYITNIVKCRPPGNRNPEADEIAACQPFLHQQLECIQPKIICALGRCAAQTLLQTSTSLSQLRGRFHKYQGIQLMPTYHPAYLLRFPDQKRLVWQDMQKVQQAYCTLAMSKERGV